MTNSFSMVRKARGTLAEENQPITESNDKPYKMVIFNHSGEMIRDVKDSGLGELLALMTKSAKKVGVTIFQADFVGAYVSEKGGKKYINSFPFDEEGEVIYPNEKLGKIEYQKPFEIHPDNTIIMPRGLGTLGLTSSRTWVDMIRDLEDDGFLTLPSLTTWDICSSKYLTDIKLRKAGLRTPKTVAVAHSEDTERAMKELGTKFPVILKSSTGTQTGVGVVIIESLRSLHTSIQMLMLYSKYLPVLIQEYIKIDYDVRVIILDGEILGSMKREVISDPQDFRSNVSLGANASIMKLTEIEKIDSIKAAEVVSGRLVGVDFIPAKNREKERPYILEVNSMPGFGGIEKLNTKKSLTEEIFKHFLNRDMWK
jgi:RimK family alpha-L-glutamate ligase